MKKIFKFLLLCLFTIMPLLSTYAAEKVDFDIEVVDITKILTTGNTIFNFSTVNVVNEDAIDHFKIRVYCKEKFTLKFNALVENSCGKVIKIPKAQKDAFSLDMKNETGNRVNFSFKLKAYDKDGKWLHSEKQSFNWK